MKYKIHLLKIINAVLCRTNGDSQRTKKKIIGIVAESYTMYNHLRCLIVSSKIHKKLLIQKSNQGNILLPMIDCYANFHIWNDTSKIYKRFYCQIAIDQKTDETDAMKNDAQQQLDEFVFSPENKKRYQILKLEVDVMRHKRLSEKVPEELNPNDWLTLLELPSKRQRKLVSFESFFFSIIFLSKIIFLPATLINFFY